MPVEFLSLNQLFLSAGFSFGCELKYKAETDKRAE
jgi:hypothetical protein